MRLSLSRALVLLPLLLLAGPRAAFSQLPGLPDLPGLDAPVAVGPYLNGTMPTVAPGTSNGWSTVNAFPNLTFVDPLSLGTVPLAGTGPGRGELILVGKDGQLWRFPNDPAVTQGQVTRVLDWRAKTMTSEDQGFYSIAFHPQFGVADSPDKDFVFACYSGKLGLPGEGQSKSLWRVARFTWDRTTGTIDPASELVLMSQYDSDLWHNGGKTYFDNAGYLNVVAGDGGDSPDSTGLAETLPRTQKLDGGLFSGIFRIDVNTVPLDSHPIRRTTTGNPPPSGWPANFNQGYRIPNSNPWQDEGGGILEEYAILGLRSPHTAHYDAVTDEVWVGDVGGAIREELSRLKRGDNAQWGYKEGIVAGQGSPAVPPIGHDTPPFLDYGRDVGNCIIGGMRYRGALWNSLLGGKVLYGDIIRGKIWCVDPAAMGAPEPELLIDGLQTGNKAGLANFCTDTAGEIYLMILNGTNQPGGTIRKLVSEGVSNPPPQFLSQTGAFTDLTTLAPAPGLIPYDVGSPLWSDGAAKQRWIALPNDGTHNTPAEKIAFNEKGNWVFPAGTVFVKHFEVGTNDTNPSQVKRLETRLLVCTEGGGKYGVTYKWNAAGTDAEVLTGAETEDFTVVKSGGDTVTRHWQYPSRADCLQCHNTKAGQALGFRTAQLNLKHDYEATGRTANQLLTYNALGMFDRVLTASEIGDFIESRAIGDVSAPLEHRVRSYLDSNCSHCHQPGGTVPYFDTRLGTPLVKQGLVNGDIAGHFPFPGGYYLRPGDPALSATLVRAGNSGNGTAMPPLAKDLTDDKAVATLTRYITGLDPAEFQHPGTVQARYVRLTALSEVNDNPWTAVAEFSILDGAGVPIPHGLMSISDFDSQELVGDNAPPSMAIDGNPATFWHTRWTVAVAPPPPHHITVDLGMARAISGYACTPRQGGNTNGRIKDYQVDFSQDGSHWLRMDEGRWLNDATVKTFTGLMGSRRPRCEIAGPEGTLPLDFDVTVAFDTEVGGFTAADLSVTGGLVTSVRGSGYYYVARILRILPQVSVQVPENAAEMGLLGNLASNTLSLESPGLTGTLFSRWALLNGLGVTGPGDDANHNGVPALAEYLFGVDPNGGGVVPLFNGLNGTGMPRATLVDGRLRVEFPRSIAAVAAGYRYVAQFSSDLAHWQDAETGPLIPLAGDWWRMTIDDPRSTPVTTGRFVRVRLIAP